jgi:hypothetical protein
MLLEYDERLAELLRHAKETVVEQDQQEDTEAQNAAAGAEVHDGQDINVPQESYEPTEKDSRK